MCQPGDNQPAVGTAPARQHPASIAPRRRDFRERKPRLPHVSPVRYRRLAGAAFRRGNTCPDTIPWSRMSESSTPQLELLPYQAELTEFLRQRDPDVWDWFARDPQGAEHLAATKFDLLKSTYRVDRETQPQLYEVVESVAAELGIVAPATVYQAQNPVGLNAALVYVPGEIHLVLHGPIASQLTPLELRGLVGHELSHYLLFRQANGQHWTTHRFLYALSHDRHVHQAHLASLRLLLLYDEIFCDRGSFQVTQDVRAVVSMLVKVHTGVTQVSADGFLKQADEVFAQGPTATRELDHPEAFIRARAVRLWAEQGRGANEAVAEMIEGAPGLETLDLLAQRRVASVTRQLVDQLFARPWFRTDVALAHARLYFDNYAPPESPGTEGAWRAGLRIEPKSLGDYFAFVLLDFVAADREQLEPALALALSLTDQIGLKERFVELARQELRLRKNQLEKIDRGKEELLVAADQEQGS